MKKIVVGVDGSPSSHKALERALYEAKCELVELVIVCVAESLSVLSMHREGDVWETLLREPKRVLAEALARAEDEGVKARGQVEVGRPAETISKIAREEKADEIVIGSLGKHAVDRLLLGSVSSRLVEVAPCTIIVVR